MCLEDVGDICQGHLAWLGLIAEYTILDPAEPAGDFTCPPDDVSEVT